MMFYETRIEIAYGVLLFVLHAQPAAAKEYYNYNGVLYIKPDPGSRVKSWPEAQSYCKSLNSTLGILDTPTQRQSFIEALSHFGLYSNEIWIGANASYGGENNWKWLNGTIYTGPAIQGASDFIRSFITISKTNTLINVNPTTGIYSFNYLCQYQASSSACESGRSLLTANGSCYVASNDATTWFSARNNCLSNGGDLAIFQDFNLISQYLTETPYWIGLRSSWWKWQNAGTSVDVTFSFWANSQPGDVNASCMSIKNGAGSDNTCNNLFNFTCQTDVWPSRTLSTPAADASSSRSSSARIMSSTSTSTSTPRTSTSTSTSTTLSTSTSTSKTLSTSISPSTSNASSSVLSSEETSSRATRYATETQKQTPLAITTGIAVGIGVPVIAIIIIVIVVIVIRRRKNEREAEEQNTRYQSVIPPGSSEATPTYMTLQKADNLDGKVNVYDELRKSQDDLQPEESGYQNLSELSP